MSAKRYSYSIVIGAAALAFAHFAPAVQAQTTYPVKPIRILVGFQPGGFTDTSARIVGAQLAEALGQQVIVENRPGANSAIAGELTAKSPPDGYTFFMCHPGIATNPVLYDNYPVNPLKDFVTVSLVAAIPNILVVHPSVPAKSVKELLAIARSRPGSLTQASAGLGSPGQLSGELLQQMTQTKFLHVPYKGSGPALIDLVGGHVDLSFPTISAGLSMVKAGKLRALGTTSSKRSPMLPDVPPIGETVPGFDVLGWYGLVGPAGIPKDIVSRISSEIARMVKTPEVRERLLREGADPIGSTPEAFASYLADEVRKWTKVIKAAKIQPSKIR